MTWTTSWPARSLCILIVVLCTACTGGQVSQNGSAVAGSDIEIRTCEAAGGTFTTTTDATGNFQFNPFDPLSPMIDSAEYIPTGPIAILVTGGNGSSVNRRDHQYTGTCPVAYNGSTQDMPCRIHAIEHVPASVPAFLGDLVDFYEDDCGFSARAADALSLSALDPDADHQADAQIFGLTDPGREASCISGCTSTCSGQAMNDFMPCMCICVESSCGASFGPFCTEAAP